MLFQRFLKFKTALVAEFYGVIHAMEEAKKWDLLMSGLNVIMSWFVLRLLLGLMFH